MNKISQKSAMQLRNFVSFFAKKAVVLLGLFFACVCGGTFPIYGADYYVDPLGDDANDGSSPATAWRTLAYAMSQATTSGDIVHAAPGVYNEGTMENVFSSYTILNRVIIPKGVGLIADQGRGITKIVGAKDPNTSGTGPLAIRAVRLESGAWIRGFTITEGYTQNKTSTTNNSAVSGGGGVYAVDASSVVVDCEIFGNRASYRGSAVVNASLLRCYIHDNELDTNGECSILCNGESSKIFDCYIEDSSVVRNVQQIVNSTLFCSVSVAGGDRSAYNCYIKGVRCSDKPTLSLYNCALQTNALTSSRYKITNCFFGVAKNSVFDTNRQPLATSDFLIDKGNNSYYTTYWNSSWDKFGQTDFAGGARFVNEAIDIGAGEYQGEPIPPPTPSKPGTIFSVHGRRTEPGVTNFILAERGMPSQWPVVIPQNYAPSEYQAAVDLREGVRLTTGCTLPFECGTNPAQGIFIKIVEDAQLGEDGFRLKIEGRRLRITGGKRGILYGVYEILERYAGCGWYAAWFSDYPTCNSITIPANLDEAQVPAFDMRGTSAYFKDAVFSAHERMNGLYQTFDTAHGGNTPYRFASTGAGLGSAHTMLNIIKPSVYKDSHPEYFAMRSGSRLTTKPTQLCLTNTDVLKLAKEYVVAAATNYPNIKFFGVSQADNQHYCECEKCQASYKTYGQSGTILNFVNAIADEVKKVRPDAWVETLAYQYSRRPPLNGVVPRDNVMICFCSIESEFGRPFRDSDTETDGYQNNIYFKEDIAVWRQIAKRIYVWDYAINFHHYPFPFLDFGVIQPNLQFFHENGVRQVYEQGGGGGTANWYGDLRIYLFSKLLWNPYVNLEPYKDKFFNTYYGSAADLIREDFEAFSALPVGGTAKPIKIYADIKTSIIPDQILADSTERWLQATELVKNDRPEVQRAVKIGLFCMDYSSVRRYAEQLENVLPIVFTADTNNAARAKADKIFAAARRAQAAIETDSTLRLSENNDRNTTNKAYIKKFANFELPPTNVNRVVVTADQLKLYSSNRGTVVSNVEGSTSGTVFKFDGTHNSYTHYLYAKQFIDDEDATYKVSVRLRATNVNTNKHYECGHDKNNKPLHDDNNYIAWFGTNGSTTNSVQLKASTVLEKYGSNGGFQTYDLFASWKPQLGDELRMRTYWYTGTHTNDTVRGAITEKNDHNPAWDTLEFDSYIFEKVQ